MKSAHTHTHTHTHTYMLEALTLEGGGASEEVPWKGSVKGSAAL